MKLYDKQKNTEPIALPPLINARQGDSQIFECGGTIPIIELWWSIVDILLACTDTKLPPMPLIIGWNTTKPLYTLTAASSTRPPILCSLHVWKVETIWKISEIKSIEIVNNIKTVLVSWSMEYLFFFCAKYVIFVYVSIPAYEQCR